MDDDDYNSDDEYDSSHQWLGPDVTLGAKELDAILRREVIDLTVTWPQFDNRITVRCMVVNSDKSESLAERAFIQHGLCDFVFRVNGTLRPGLLSATSPPIGMPDGGWGEWHVDFMVALDHEVTADN